jgi:predicted TIM-barrel fold metal-dependent hydrolase
MNCGKIDLNGYYGRWPYWGLRHGSVEEMLRLMDRYGIERAALASTRAIFSDWERGNEEVRTVVERWPDRFLGVISINPVLGERQLDRFEEYVVDNRVIGLRLYPIYHSYKLGVREPILDAIFQRLETLGLPVFIPLRLMMNWAMPVLPIVSIEKVVARFPSLRIVIEGVNYEELKQILPLILDHDSIYIETSCLQLRGAIERLVSLIGIGRILFGTGMPLQNPACEIAKISHLKLSEEDKEAIFKHNAERFLKRGDEDNR